MANTVYPLFLQSSISGGAVDVTSATIKAMLVDSSYTYSAAHQFVSDVASGAIIQRGAAGLASKTDTDGVFDAADFTFSAVPSGHTIAGIVIYDDSPATDATKPLLAFIDHDAASAAISLVTNGSDVLVTWNAAGIFSL